MATDLAKVKRNVAKMVSMNAPEADIDAYIASEGTTVDAIKAFKPVSQPGELPSAQSQGAQDFGANASKTSQQFFQKPQPGSTLPGPLRDIFNFNQAFQQGATQGMTLGFGDELLAGAQAPIQMGIDAVQGKGFDPGASYNKTLDMERATEKQQAAYNPLASAIGEGVGAITLGGSLPSLAAKATSPLAVAGAGALEGTLYGSTYGAGKGETADQRIQGAQQGALSGFALGALVPTIINGVGKGIGNAINRNAVNAAIKDAPSSQDLKAAASAMFKSVDNSGVTADTNKFGQMVSDLVQKAKKDRINPNLDPKATEAYKELIGALQDVQGNLGSLKVSDLHTLRQIAQKAATSADGRDGMFAQRIVDALDDFVSTPQNLVMPQNQIGNGQTAGNELLKAISTWSQGRKTSLIEEAIYKASIQKSGMENGLRLQFGSLLRNPKTRRLFSEQEIKAITEVANGTGLSNLVTLAGKFGFGTNGATNMLGGSIGSGIGATLGSTLGPMGSIAGAALTGTVATAMRKLAEKIGVDAAERVAKIVGSENIPALMAQKNPFKDLGPILGGNIAGQMQQPNKPLQITVKGTAS